MTTISPNVPGGSGYYSTADAQSVAPKNDSAVASGATAAAGPQDLTEAQLKVLAAVAPHFGDAAWGLDDFGATAISLPEVEGPTLMQALSTADLLQLIRTESRKTTELLLATTMQSIKNLQAQIDVNSKSSIAELEVAAKKQDKAEKMMKVMNVVKWAAIAVGVVACTVAVIGSGGAAAPLFIALVSAAMMITTTCLSEFKGKDGTSPMDKLMKGLGDKMEKLAKAYGDTPAWLKAAVVVGTVAATIALAVAAPSTLALTLPLLAVAIVGALPDKWVSDDMKGQIMASIVMTGAMIAVSVLSVSAGASMVASEGSVAVAAAQQAVTESVESAAQSAAQVADEVATAVTESTSSAAQSAVQALAQSVDEAAGASSSLQSSAQSLRKGTEILKATLELGNSGAGIVVAVDQFHAAKANASVMALREMVKMLETLLDGDASFAQTLASVQAQLDAGCAEIVATEHQTNENINHEMFS